MHLQGTDQALIGAARTARDAFGSNARPWTRFDSVEKVPVDEIGGDENEAQNDDRHWFQKQICTQSSRLTSYEHALCL